MKIHGITIKPRWKWSKWYTAHVRENLRYRPRSSQAEYEKVAVKYARWLAERDGISLRLSDEPGWEGEANHTICHWTYGQKGKQWGRLHIQSVEFSRMENRWPTPRDWDERQIIATIEIPNFDYRPEPIERRAWEEPDSTREMALPLAA